MGPLTEFVAAKTWLDGGGKQVNLESDATTMGGTDHMAERMLVLNKEGGTDRFVLGWNAMVNHTVNEQMKLHALTFDAIRRAGEAGLDGEMEALGRDQEELEREAAEHERRTKVLARMAVDSDVIAATMGDHAKDQKTKVRALQVIYRETILHEFESVRMHCICIPIHVQAFGIEARTA